MPKCFLLYCWKGGLQVIIVKRIPFFFKISLVTFYENFNRLKKEMQPRNPPLCPLLISFVYISRMAVVKLHVIMWWLAPINSSKSTLIMLIVPVCIHLSSYIYVWSAFISFIVIWLRSVIIRSLLWQREVSRITRYKLSWRQDSRCKTTRFIFIKAKICTFELVHIL